jgi:hypothetical protein
MIALIDAHEPAIVKALRPNMTADLFSTWLASATDRCWKPWRNSARPM